MPSITNTSLSACALTLLLPAAMAQTVTVSGGQVAGRAMDDGSAIFYGIPYAASPAGAQRWQAPAPRAPWQGVLDASQPAPACVQADVGWNRAFVQGAQEDCLTLAIRTPSLQASARLPVLVYIHGGSNAAGGAGSLADDAIHREGIVLVKIQYRLGAFGFLTDNHGLQDQIAALRWVRANIAAFGGDPSLVTISGNSAGATDALFLTYSPLAQGLFRRAILQSAAPGAPRSRAHSEAMRDTLLDRLRLPHGEPGMTVLRALPADAIQTAAQNLPTSAGVDPSFTWEQQNLDGAVMADGYADAYAKGAGHDIDIIIGSNTQELGADRKAETGDALVQAAFGTQTAAARALYDRRGDKAALGSLPTQVMTDMWFRCPAHWLSRRMHGTGARVWRYEFGYGAPGSHKPPEHTSEMDYIYRAPSANWPPLQRYWANFIRTGNPNGADLPEWPEVAQRDASLSIAPEGIKAVRGAHAALCELMFSDVDYPQSANAELTATTKVSGGALVGLQADQLKTYLGIPYAAPPVGPLRWRAPQAVPPWRGVKLANRYSAACAQTAQWVTHPKSEDCLYLNIWAPAASEKLPVLVWIHGGGYYGGTAAQAGFDGAHLARRGAVVVTLNYRLGIFGFFAHPELPGGNQGILDQIAALRWVKQNIAAFGGDPARVTIFGESAGGESVAILVASPLAKGLFQRAIAQSGNDGLPMYAAEHHRFLDLASARANGAAFAQAAGAPRLADLRKLSVAELHRQPWSPRTFIDGHLLREDLSTTYRHQRQNDVPLLVGWNAEEGKDLAPEILGTSELTAAKHRALVSKLLGHAPSTALLSAYPGASDSQAAASLNQLTNDWWGWRMAYWARLQARHGRAKSYVYFFAHQPAAPLTPCGYGCGAGHGAEIPYVFDNLDQDRRPWRTADRQLAGRLATSWINFARTGNPNSDGLPPWPSYDGSADTIMRIGAEAELKAHPLPDFSLFERHLGGQN